MKRNFGWMIFLFLAGTVCSCAWGSANPEVVLVTNFGDIVIELYPADAPVTVDNFLNYVNSGYYNSLLFHRVIENFMIQGGYFLYYNGLFYYRATGDPIINESYNGLSNLRGTIAMARSTDPDSATSQFFINHVDNIAGALNNLDRTETEAGYCVFGNVIEGMDVVDAIAVLDTIPNGLSPYFPNNPMAGMYQAYVRPCTAPEYSDFSGDGTVGFEDIAVLLTRWLDDCGSANDFCDGLDLDYSGTVDLADIALLTNNLGTEL